MLYEKLPVPSLASRAERMAERAAITALMRCFCREIGAPRSLIALLPPDHHGPLPAQLRGANMLLQISLTEIETALVIGAHYASETQDYHFCTRPYLRQGRRYRALDWRQLAELLYAETARLLDAAPNAEIIEQTANSVAITARLIAHRLEHPRAMEGTRGMADYLRSEGSLIFGHASHPTPKSRQGVDIDLMVRHSPEILHRFDLNYVAVRRERLWSCAAEGPDAWDQLAACLPAGLADQDWAALPVHPVQARKLSEAPAFARAIREGWLRNLGTVAKPYHATSSVRTLLDSADPFFLKLSLDMRLTNCVRKNAEYELTGAVAATRLIREKKAEFEREFPDCIILEEPASLSVEPPPSWEADERRALVEGHGLILRQSLAPLTPPDVTPLVAGALFTAGLDGRSPVRRVMGDDADDARIIPWFRAYAEHLIHPIFYGYFRHGLIFEPHLQNVVIGLRDRMPARLYLRDFEGVKVTDASLPGAIKALDAQARSALSYSAEQGWRRITYCLFVNNLCEAIHHLSHGDDRLRQALWAEVEAVVAAYQRLYGDTTSRERLLPLLSGAPLPSKAMLITRFLQQADREAGYVDLANPMGR